MTKTLADLIHESGPSEVSDSLKLGAAVQGLPLGQYALRIEGPGCIPIKSPGGFIFEDAKVVISVSPLDGYESSFGIANTS